MQIASFFKNQNDRNTHDLDGYRILITLTESEIYTLLHSNSFYAD